jgi:N-acetylglucosamine-6-sulfatase
MYDESQRMPFLVRYPGRFQAGSTLDDMVTNVDFAPTLLELASVDKGDMPDDFQGRSFVANLEGRTPDDWPEAVYYRYWLHMAHHDNPAHYGIRTRTHKLIFFYGLPLEVKGAVKEPTEPHWELYDLVKDPHEMNNVYADPSYANVASQLKARLAELKHCVGDSDERYPDLIRVHEAHWGYPAPTRAKFPLKQDL